MANSESADLMSIGHHCAEPNCGQVDFLPFRCDCCRKTFCLEHRTYEAHKCPYAGSKQTEIIVCPLCALAIKLRQGEDPNRAFEMHQRQGCDTQNYARVHKKRTCPVENCREKLTTINSYTCKDCGTEICLKHRLPSDHKCKEIQAARRTDRRQQWGVFSTRPSTAKRAMQTGVSSSAPLKGTWTARKEMCQQCGARFSDVHQLIQHVESYHPQESGSSGSASERCPYCSRQFSNAVQLVEHVESQSCQGSKRTCAIS